MKKKIKIRTAAGFALLGTGLYTLYYLLAFFGSVFEVQELIKINPAMHQYVKQFGVIRVLLLPGLVYIPIMYFLYAMYER